MRTSAGTRAGRIDGGVDETGGTPAGVGHTRRPPVFLRDGQTVRTVIDGVGELNNRCVAEKGALA
jgi:acylpyruvate hydrolase